MDRFGYSIVNKIVYKMLRNGWLPWNQDLCFKKASSVSTNLIPTLFWSKNRKVILIFLWVQAVAKAFFIPQAIVDFFFWENLLKESVVSFLKWIWVGKRGKKKKQKNPTGWGREGHWGITFIWPWKLQDCKDNINFFIYFLLKTVDRDAGSSSKNVIIIV